MTTEEGNRIISEFLKPSIPFTDSREGRIRLYYTPVHDATCCRERELEYHTSWDWLMPVVYRLHEAIDEYSQVFAGLPIFELGLTTPIGEVWAASINAIQWYNKQQEVKK